MSKFKVGDRVRVLRTDYEGDIGVGEIRKVVGACDDGVYLEWIAPSGRDDSLYFMNSEVELLPDQPATLTIQAGKFYKTRNGRKVLVRDNGSDTTFPFYHDRGCGSYHGITAGGRSCVEHRHEDIIAEWRDEPATTAYADRDNNSVTISLATDTTTMTVDLDVIIGKLERIKALRAELGL